MSSSPLTPEEIRAAAEVYHELGPQYSDAVVESFLERIDQEVEARIKAQVAALPQPPARQPGPSPLARRRTFLAGAAVGVMAAGIPLTNLAFHLAGDFGPANQEPLVMIWIVIGLIFVAAIVGVTGVVTVRIRRPSESAGPARH